MFKLEDIGGEERRRLDRPEMRNAKVLLLFFEAFSVRFREMGTNQVQQVLLAGISMVLCFQMPELVYQLSVGYL